MMLFLLTWPIAIVGAIVVIVIIGCAITGNLAPLIEAICEAISDD